LPLSSQVLFPGPLQDLIHQQLHKLKQENSIPKLWAKESDLWPDPLHERNVVRNNLRWLDLPDQLPPLIRRVVERAGQIEPAGLEDVVFITFGEANLAARSALRFPGTGLGKRTFLLDNIDPAAVRALEKEIQLPKALFIFASKTGKNIETHSLLLYFLGRLKALGISSPAQQIVSLTEESSYLGELSKEYDFIDAFHDPPGVLGRFSSLIHFSFFLAAVCRLNVEELMTRTLTMREACQEPAPERNPAASLAAFLAAARNAGLDRMVIFSPSILQPVALRLGSLVGASMCRGGSGVVPVYGRVAHELEMFRHNSFAVSISLKGKEVQELESKASALRGLGVPEVRIELNGPEDLPAELFKWEIGTALACLQLEVNPFYDPDLRESRTRSAQALEEIVAKRGSAMQTVRVRDREIELYAEGGTRQQISTISLQEAFRTFFKLRVQDGYIAVLPFLPFSDSQKKALYRIKAILERVFRLPVLLTPGPRYLQTLGQIYLGGPAKGLFLILSSSASVDLAIPGADFTFGQLQLALALGEFDSLGRRRRPVIRLHFSNGADSGLSQLELTLAGMFR
jgi:hypothetical protein